jgi:hypothetical protein
MDATLGVLVVLVLIAVVWAMRRARKRREIDHGSVSEGWIAEQRGKGPRDGSTS